MTLCIKELKDRLSKINQLLDKLDERLVQGELSEAKYKELSEKYRTEADSLKNQITEKELLQEVGLKAEEKKEPIVEHPAELQEKSYLSKVIQRLQNEGFDCYENVTYNDYFLKFVAKKVISSGYSDMQRLSLYLGNSLLLMPVP